jgi:hypothetical protein
MEDSENIGENSSKKIDNSISILEFEVLELKKEKYLAEIDNLKTNATHKINNSKWIKYDVRVKAAGYIISAVIIAFTVFYAMDRNLENRESEVRINELKNEERYSQIDQKVRYNENLKNQILADKAKLDLELIARKKDSLSKISELYKNNIALKSNELLKLENSTNSLFKKNANLQNELIIINNELDFRQTAYHLEIFQNDLGSSKSEEFIIKEYIKGHMRLVDSINSWSNSSNTILKLCSLRIKFKANPDEINILQVIDASLKNMMTEIPNYSYYATPQLNAYWNTISDTLLYNDKTRIPIFNHSVEIVINEKFKNHENYIALAHDLMSLHCQNLVNLKRENIKNYFHLLKLGIYAAEMEYPQSNYILSSYAPEFSVLMYIKMLETETCGINRLHAYDDFYIILKFIGALSQYIDNAMIQFDNFSLANKDFKLIHQEINMSNLSNMNQVCGSLKLVSSKYKQMMDLYFNLNSELIDNADPLFLLQLAQTFDD